MMRGKIFLNLFVCGLVILIISLLYIEKVNFAFSQEPQDYPEEFAPEVPEVEEISNDEDGEDLYPEETIDVPQENADTPEETSKEKDNRISLDLKGIDITEVFRLLSLKTGMTIVPSKNVKGRINIFLNNVTFEDALDVILVTQELAVEHRGNILMIMTNAEYKSRYGKVYDEKRQVRTFKLQYAKPSSVFSVLEKLKSEVGRIIVDEASGIIILIDIPSKLILMSQTIQDLDQPLETEIFDLQYADAEDIKSHLGDAITDGTGELYVDKRTSKVVVSDLPTKMSKIKRMVKAFDEEARQVFIEAEIIQITLRDEYQRGINWEEVFSEDWSSGLKFAGTFPVTSSFTPSPAIPSPIGSDPSGKTAFRMNVGTLADDKYDAVMDFLETYGDTKILSRPKIAVMNNEEAKILVGTREAYVTQTLSQAETTTVTSENIEFVDVGVKLSVLPTINKDGFIMMKIKPEVSSVSTTLETQLGSTVPIIETSEAETVVKVKDGTMIMIAGLIKDEVRKDTTGVPFLSKIPVLGGFFGAKAEQTEKTEIIVFLKPRITKGEAVLLGTEPEKSIPPIMMPDQMRESIIKKELESIKVTPEQKSAKSTVEKIEEAVIEEKGAQLQQKLKGFKDF